ncbi:MAG: PQQ-like beta-propeller repeat protein [Campylobacteraceae bacterium]|jgi:outer membrane protein assembly factor BamB|nr:PQQ-like beta-propeller repeat protein [Campylobacteraceae bacterium]
MLKTVSLSCVIACAVFMSGCGTKRQYFEPQNLQGSIQFDGSLSSSIKEITRDGASLKNGGVITRNGNELNINLEDKYNFFGEFDGKFITATPNGFLHVKNSDGKLIYSKDIRAITASASIGGDTLAIVTSDNILYLIDINSNVTIFQKKMDAMPAIDSRIAAPYFLGSLVIFPTLDGKLTIVDRNNGTLVRNVVVSGEREFNNIIFLDVIDDRMFASTAKRIIGIKPDGINYIDEEIKDAIVAEDRVFIFTKDGRVILADLDLKILSEQKFSFAIFSAVAAKNKLYIIEKRGYLIKSDLDLKNFEIFKLPFDVEDSLFVTDSKIYYGNSFYTLE